MPPKEYRTQCEEAVLNIMEQCSIADFPKLYLSCDSSISQAVQVAKINLW